MSREGAIKIEGVVVEAVNERLYRVELPNGHRLLAHLPGKRRHPGFQAGDKVTVEVSPFDFSKGCISLETTNEL